MIFSKKTFFKIQMPLLRRLQTGNVVVINATTTQKSKSKMEEKQNEK